MKQMRLKTSQVPNECAVYRCKSPPAGQSLGVGYLCVRHFAEATTARDAGGLELTGAPPKYGVDQGLYNPAAVAADQAAELAAVNQPAFLQGVDWAGSVADESRDLPEILELIKNYPVLDEAAVEFARQERKSALELRDVWKKRLASIIDPLKASTDSAKALLKPLVDGYDAVGRAWGDKMIARKQEQDAAQVQLLQQAQVAQEPAEIQQAMIAASEAVTAPPQGISYVDNWKWEVTNLDEVPRGYLTVDPEKVGPVVKALKDKASIPGIRVYNDPFPRGR
jgi:hypothetical protein